jgi:hypothetical protein
MFGKLPTVFSTFFNIHKADGNHGPSADGKEEWETHPIVAGIVDDGLDDIGTDDGRLDDTLDQYK